MRTRKEFIDSSIEKAEKDLLTAEHIIVSESGSANASASN